jgi:hypothetical protein
VVVKRHMVVHGVGGDDSLIRLAAICAQSLAGVPDAPQRDGRDEACVLR